MLEAYFDAFEDFLRTGSAGRLAEFAESGVDPAYLSVYRNGYLKTCIDSLAASYPVVVKLVGEDCFRGLARRYVDTHPPGSGTLVGYGTDFAGFLRAQQTEHGLDYLADIAAIDAAWLASFFAEDAEALTPADIESMSAEGVDVASLCVRLTPTTRMVSLDHPIVDTWILLREQGSLTHEVGLQPGESKAMVWRLDGQIHVRELQPGEAAFLSSLAGGTTLSDASERAFAVEPSFDLAGTFSALLQNKILQSERRNA